jgi:plastocyanin
MRRRLVSSSGLFALAAVGIIAGLLTPLGTASRSVAHKPAVITVTAKEFSFALSKRSVPVGTTVTFKVVNKGKITHNFLIAGKLTKMLSPGQSANLTVKFPKKGQFLYVCTLTGHANAGMKGKFAVGVKALPAPKVTTTTVTTTTPTTTTTSTVPVGTAQT